MKSLPRTSKLALLGLTGLLALPVSAQNLGIYGGLQAGYSRPDTREHVIELDNDEIYGIYAGYKFLDWLGLEAGYSRLGKFGIESLDDVDVDGVGPIEMDSYHVALSLWGPFIGPVGTFAKIGAHATESQLGKKFAGEDFAETTTNLYYSVGLTVPVVDFLSITIAYENYRNIKVLEKTEDMDLGKAGIDAFSLGVVFNF